MGGGGRERGEGGCCETCVVVTAKAGYLYSVLYCTDHSQIELLLFTVQCGLHH